MRFETGAIQIGEELDKQKKPAGDIIAPIHLTTTFGREEINQPGEFAYSRTNNPTRSILEKKLAFLEKTRFGLAFSSGVAAEATLLFSLLQPGDHIIAFDDLYGGTKRLFHQVLNPNFRVEISYVDATQPTEVEKALRPNTRLVWLETPTNPLMKICDLKTISSLVKKKFLQTLIVVDNTFASPYFQNPLLLGADIVLHSTTKYINGHSDSIGGAIMLSDKDLYQKLKFNQNAIGAIMSPFDCFLVTRGLKTLSLRMKQHQANALKIAEFLEKHPRVAKVNYPGLPSHPQYELAKKQMSGFSGVLSFELDTDWEGLKKFLGKLKRFYLAESLGGVESLIGLPAFMSHGSLTPEQRKKAGISETLIRLSVGIENIADLLEDIEEALKL